jgi:1-acyl-sn-glycerol-3-phosphate acyltransferase
VSVPPFHWWRTVFFLIPTIGLYTAVLGALSIGSALAGGKGRFAHRCARLWSWLILATTGVRVSVRGLDRVRPDRSYLFISNHQSIYDIPIAFWNVPFDLRIIAKASLRRVPFIGGHLRRTGHVLVDRANPGPATFREVSQLLQRGQSLIVFPEGTRSADGRVARFRSGIFVLAIGSGLPVVPVAIRGSRHVMKKGRLMTCPGVVSIEVFEPIPTAGLTRDDAKELAGRVQAVVEQGVEGDQDPEFRSVARIEGAPA